MIGLNVFPLTDVPLKVSPKGNFPSNVILPETLLHVVSILKFRVTFGKAFNVISCLVEAVQLLASVTVTVYVVLLVGLTLVLGEVDPVFQEYEFPPLAVNVVDCPLHIGLFPLIPAVGFGLTVTDIVLLAVQPFASVTVKVYVVLDPGLIVIPAVDCQ